MAIAHLKQLQVELEKRKWVIQKETFEETWIITKFNGDYLLKLSFHIAGKGLYGAFTGDEIVEEDACGCFIEEVPEVTIYFGKYSGQFQIDILTFMQELDKIEQLLVNQKNPS